MIRCSSGSRPRTPGVSSCTRGSTRIAPNTRNSVVRWRPPRLPASVPTSCAASARVISSGSILVSRKCANSPCQSFLMSPPATTSMACIWTITSIRIRRTMVAPIFPMTAAGSRTGRRAAPCPGMTGGGTTSTVLSTLCMTACGSCRGRFPWESVPLASGAPTVPLRSKPDWTSTACSLPTPAAGLWRAGWTTCRRNCTGRSRRCRKAFPYCSAGGRRTIRMADTCGPDCIHPVCALIRAGPLGR